MIDTQIMKIPKYKLNDSSVRNLLNNEPINEPGNKPNKNIEPFFISTCFVFKYPIDDESPVTIKMTDEVPIAI